MELGRNRGMMANEHITASMWKKVKTCKYLGSLLTNQHFIHGEIKCRIKGGNSRYYSVQNFYLLDF